MVKGPIYQRVRDTVQAIGVDQHNAFISVDEVRAAADAQDADNRVGSSNVRGPLDGVMIAVKDCIDTADVATTCGTALYLDRVARSDANAVARLRDAGAIIIGKTNMTELACGTVGYNTHFGTVKNPRDPARYPGGSSSGSAAAVAAGLVPLALGSDTTCSVRTPAAACGVVGLKPTYGRVSNTGLHVSYATTDHIGPLAESVPLAALALAAMQDPGWDDPTARLHRPVGGLRIGLLQGPFIDSCADDVKAMMQTVESVLSALGCSVDHVDLGVDLVRADRFSNAFGHDLLDAYGDDIAANRALVGPTLLGWVELYRGRPRADYAEALVEQLRLSRQVDRLMLDWDALLCPTTRAAPALLSDVEAEARETRDGNCTIWAMTGLPSLTIPFGRSESGMPLGLLINAARGADALALQIGSALSL